MAASNKCTVFIGSFASSPERISLVTSRSVLLESAAERAAQRLHTLAFRFILAHKNGIVVIGTFVNHYRLQCTPV